MPSTPSYDAVVVGSGPNGLAAAITLAQAGWKTLVIEARETPGGGSRSAEVTLPGFIHDICSAVHPLAQSSRFFKSLNLEQFGLHWIYSPLEVAHPLDRGRAVLAERSLEQTTASLGQDGRAYRRLMNPFIQQQQALLEDIHGPFPLLPHHPVTLARFGLKGVQSAFGLARRHFNGEPARALFGGHSAHSILPLTRIGTAAAGILIGSSAHTVGWPVAQGGSQTIVTALVSLLKSLGGEVQTGWYVKSLSELPSARATLLDLTPRALIELAGEKAPSGYRRQLERFQYGSGIFKIDYALNGPIPWQNPEINRSITVHVGGTLDEITASEAAIGQGDHADQPFVLLSQPTLFDPSRAPAGKHTAWAYCHVPHGSSVDMTDRIESQIERFAPGFRECILARKTTNSVELETYNPNYVGGDISSGRQDIIQQFARPVPSLQPYRTPLPGLYLCSASTPPGGGVHGMCGYHAARCVLKDIRS